MLDPIEGVDGRVAAEALIAHFGSLRAVLAAPQGEQLRAVGNRAVVRHLATVRQAMLWSLRQEVEARPFLGNRDAVLDYLRLAYGSDAFEEVRIFYLDSRFCLLREERQGRGAPDEAIVSTAQVIGRALELGASGLVMVHNHPSGDPAPSQADKDITRRMAAAAAALGMRLFDHVIVAEGGCYSFRGEGLL